MTAAHFSLFDTALGGMAIVWRGSAVIGLRLPDRDADHLRRSVTKGFPAATEHALDGAAKEAADAVAALVSGEKRDLTFVAVELPAFDAVTLGALTAARDIPPGETATYGEVARKLGDIGLARRVGQAMGRNPVPVIIPCHRVLGAGGKLTGFSAPGGVDAKLKLLEIEGALRPSLFEDLPLVRKR